ncbi:hypothetical protein ACJMK2_036950, partial [Sinanodonta woodiana]
FSMDDLAGEKVYLLNLNISVCLDGKAPCVINTQVFENTRLPKPICDWNSNFTIPGFSLIEWTVNNDYPLGQSLTSLAQEKLVEALGLAPYLLQKPCNYTVGPFSSAVDGWNKDCVIDQHPASLPEFMVCHIPRSCTGVECCTFVNTVGMTFRTFLHLDPCTYRLSIGIEELQFNISLLNYDWGKKKTFYLAGVVRMEFSIEDLSAERLYLVNMMLSVCFETRSSCMIKVPLLQNTLMPKALCSGKLDYYVSDFSLQAWLQENGLHVYQTLTFLDISKLLEKMGISYLLNDHKCDRQQVPFVPQSDGWNSSCPYDVKLPSLPSGVACHIPSLCTGVQCCVDVEFLNRSFNAFLLLDSCNYKLTVGIEKLNFTKHLFDYSWGKQDQFWLFGAVRLDYTIINIASEAKFLVNLTLSVCFEANDSCSKTIPIFRNALLPKVACDWSLDFINPEFSLKKWYQDLNVPTGNNLGGHMLMKLLNDLGLTPYLLDQQCDPYDNPYTPINVDGWNITCPSKVETLTLPDSVVCHIPAYCTGVQCCMNVELLQRHISTHLVLDSCNYQLTVSIEKLSFSIALFDFEYGKKTSVQLQGVFGVQFLLDNLQTQRIFILSLNLTVCFEAHDECAFQIPLFKNARLPKPVCEWTSGFVIPGFSLEAWLQERQLSADSLGTLAVSQLLSDMGIAPYLQEEQCKLSNQASKWDSDCPLNISLPALPDNLSCHITDKCTYFDCCAHMDFIDRSFRVFFYIDDCSQKLTFGVEKMKFSVSLFDFEWGTVKDFYLRGVIHVRYSVADLPVEMKYLVSLNISICFESSGNCVFNATVLDNSPFPKLPCDWNSTFINPDFSLSSWFAEKGYQRDTILSENQLSELIERLGVTEYLLQDSCVRTAAPYIPSVAGWSKACPLGISLPNLLGPVSCHVTSHCTRLECCLGVDVLQRAVKIFMFLDPCAYQMTIGIEKLTYLVDLMDFEWDFSLSSWLDKKGLLHVQSLPKYILYQLTEDMGVGSYLNDKSCDRSVAPYAPHSGGFSTVSDCPLDVQLLSLPGSVTCYMSNFCTGVHCCVDVPILQRSVHAFLEINACQYKLRAGIEKLTFEKTLFDYKWGTEDFAWLMGIFRINFTIFDLPHVRSYLVNMDIGVCFEARGQCDIITTIFKNTQLAKLPCTFDSGFFQNNFSLSDWQSSMGVPPNSQLSLILSYQLLEDLGIAAYMMDTNCQTNSLQYTPATYGWKNACPFMVDLPHLPDSLACNLPSYCTGVDCCVEVDLIASSFNVYLVLDPCSYTLMVGIERLKTNISLINYVFGTWSNFYLDGVVRLSYKILDFQGGRKFFVSLNISICLENFGSCLLSVPVLTDTILPKTNCDWANGFSIEGFSLANWLYEKGLQFNSTLNTTLPSIISSLLLENLGVAKYLNNIQCNSSAHPYIKGQSQWNNECPMLPGSSLHSQPATVACHVPPQCTGVECCVFVPLISRSIHVFVDIDDCNYQMTVGIEKLVFNVTLFNYDFGKKEYMDLDGMVQLNFSIVDLKAKRKYLINMEVGVCFESEGPCLIRSTIFKDVTVPKKPCLFNASFLNQDFSLSDWTINKSLDLHDVLSEKYTMQLFEELGIAEYLLADMCNPNSQPYNQTATSWSSACSLISEGSPLPDLMVCHIHSLCTGVACCSKLAFVDRPFYTSLLLDPCSKIMTVTIENMQFNVSLIDYSWEKQEQFFLFGVVQLRFNIKELQYGQKYLMNLDLSICLDPKGDCHLHVKILEDALLLKLPCQLESDFVPAGFSFSNWLINEEINMSFPLSNLDQSQLFEFLGITSYLLDDQCNRTNYPYYSSYGWTNDCMVNTTLPDLPQEASCYIPVQCTAVQCCIDSRRINRAVSTRLKINPCDFILTIGIEKLQFNISLLDFKWGTIQKFYMNGIFRMDFKVDDLYSQGGYLVSLNISVCLEASYPCVLVVQVFKNTFLTKTPCAWDAGFLKPGFSLTKWLQDRNATLGSMSEKVQISFLYEELGIAPFLKDEMCNVNASKAWQSDCANELTLPILPNNIHCSISETCTSVQCCVPVDTLTRNINTSLSIDTCGHWLTIQIEKMTVHQSLYEYQLGTTKRLSLYGVFNVDFRIQSLQYENAYVVNMNLSACLEPAGNCVISVPVLKNTKLPKPNCGLTQSYSVKDFSLRYWLEVMGQNSSQHIKSYIVSLLLDDLEMARYLKNSACDISVPPFQGAVAGWRNECKSDLQLQNMTDNLTVCHVSSKCNIVECCIHVNTFNRFIQTSMEIDPCNLVIKVQIERMQHQISFADYTWGTVLSVDLRGVFRMRFQMKRDDTSGKYTVDLSFSICFEANDACETVIPIFQNTILPIQKCNFSATFFNPRFSLSSWLAAEGVNNSLALSDVQFDKLIQDLGLLTLLQTDQCNISSDPFQPNILGWKNECSEIGNLSMLPSEAVCQVSSDCMRLSCCVVSYALRRTLNMTLEIDTCSYQLKLNLEKLSLQESLLNYEWGKREIVTLYGVFQLGYTLNNIVSTQKIKADVSLKVCFESSGQCVLDLLLFQGVDLPYSACDRTRADNPFPGVSFDLWQLNPCDRKNFVQTSCKANLTETGGICAMQPGCKEATCCIPNNFIHGDRNVSLRFRIDNCSKEIIYSLERKEWNKTMAGFSFDVEQTEKIGDIFEVNFTVKETATSYILNLTVEICGLKSGINGCDTLPLFQNLELDQSSCSGRRRKRFVNGLDSFKSRLQQLVNEGAKNEDIQEFLKSYNLDEITKKAKNLINIPIDPSDTGTGYHSILKSLGSHNPTTLPFTQGLSLNQGSSQGADLIKTMLGSVADLAGRTGQKFVIGKGLSNAGIQLLGEQLATMTIGDLEAMLSSNKIDPLQVFKLTQDLIDLMRALISELISKVISRQFGNAFSSFDLVLKGDFGFPKVSTSLFHVSHQIPIAGIIMVTFEFGAGCYYGMDITLALKLLSMKAQAVLTPYGGAMVYGEVGVGFILYAKLQLVGYIMDLRFPNTAEIGFSKFPLDVGLKMDLVLVPLRLELNALVTLEVKLLFVRVKKVLFRGQIWTYTTPEIRKNIINNIKEEQDSSPPEMTSAVKSDGRGKRSSPGRPQCDVQQLPNKDYTNPTFQISVAAADDKSSVKLFLDVGTVPGGHDSLHDFELGGQSTVLEMMLKPTGVPLYFTVYAENSQGVRSSVSCSVSTYDVTLPDGRFTAEFTTTSNPSTLKSSVVVYEDSPLDYIHVGVGYGKNIFGTQLKEWTKVDLNKRISNINTGDDPLNLRTLEHFTGIKKGKLVGPIYNTLMKIPTSADCARKCLDLSELLCLSFNFDYGTTGQCELMQAIEGHDHKLAEYGLFYHFERLGIGHAVEFRYELNLEHNTLYFFNLDMRNTLGYRHIISTEGILVDLTPPEPGKGLIANSAEDRLETIPCLDGIPNDRRDWEIRCVGVHSSVLNHRIVIDGPGSRTVFNGDVMLTDLRYTRSNNFISANWDGIHDKETGLLGYSWAVGTRFCEELIHYHHDPHRHLLSQSQWTNMGLIYPIPAPYTVLPDGKYYVTLRALNNVQYGGPLSLTVCHTTPYVVDTSPPLFHEIFNMKYNEDTFEIFAQYNVSDPHSNVSEIDLCMGITTRDCALMNWFRYPYGQNISHIYQIPDGVPAWIRLRAINNVELRTIGHANQAIIVDRTPPIPGVVFDGPIFRTDLMFTMNIKSVCVSWFNFYDPESGIGKYEAGVGTEPGLTNIVTLTAFDSHVHESCLKLEDGRQLEHNKTYYTVIWASNQGIQQRNTSAVSDGVTVDLTPPVEGQVVDGNISNFQDLEFSASRSTVKLQWRNYYDPESDIKHYEVQVLRSSNDSGQFEVIKDFTTFSNDTSSASWQNFHLFHRDRVKLQLRAVNRALNTKDTETNSFIVDLTPPVLVNLGDGTIAMEDKEFQSDSNQLSSNFEFYDAESGIDHFRIQVYQYSDGSKSQIYPGTDGDWYNINTTTLNQYTQTGLTLHTGAKYSMRVAAVNRAGIVAAYDTNGVIIDTTAPEFKWLYIGVMSGQKEEKLHGYAWQSDHSGIKCTFLAVDPESGITGLLVAVGTKENSTDIQDWRDIQADARDVYIDNLVLQNTIFENNNFDNNPISNVYYVTIRARNGADLLSDPVVSTPIVVIPEDVAGIAIDGLGNTMEQDIDYQWDISSVTMRFSGFTSHLHGVASFQWAVGTTPYGEDVLPFIQADLSHEEEANVPGNGIASHGYTHTNLPLDHGVTYYTSVRAITNEGNVLEAVTDGFKVDVTPPNIYLDRLSEQQMAGKSFGTIYQQSTDTLTAAWHFNDTEILDPKVLDNIEATWYEVGTYPLGEDIWNMTESPLSPLYEASLPLGQVVPHLGGKPNIVSLLARNKAGLTSHVISPSVVVDQTPPLVGIVTCPTYVQDHTAMECEWSGFFDEESPIVKFRISLETYIGESVVLHYTELPGTTWSYTVKEVDSAVLHGETYHIKVVAVNQLNLSSLAYSGSITVDKTPPSGGIVVELLRDYRVNVTSDVDTVQKNLLACQTEEECKRIDSVCQESFTSISAAWQPFRDEESRISKYQLGVGTTPGGTQLKSFFDVPAESNNYVIKGLDLYGLRQVFVTVKGINGASLMTVSTSDGVYLSYLSQGQEPLSHVGIWDHHPDAFHDIDYQTDVTTLYAKWDISGDPCPAIQSEWAVERLDGLIIQDYLNTYGRTNGYNDQLQLEEGQRYYSLLRVRNAIGFEYTLRSNGVTIHHDPLIAGQVYDGDVAGYDLPILSSQYKAMANWEGFGMPREAIRKIDILTGNAGVQISNEEDIPGYQKVSYYEVALGTDRRFSKTQNNIVPFTNVGRNTSVTFLDLDLIPGSAVYYFTVKAYSESYSTAIVTSNGFYVGFEGGVTAATIDMPRYVNVETYLDMQWNDFYSKVDILMYYVGVSDQTEALKTSCKRYIDGGRNTPEENSRLFNIYAVTNVGRNTFARLQNLKLIQGKTYYAWAMGMDKAGECNMSMHEFTIDVTPPIRGQLRAGPYFGMAVSYTPKSDSITAYWEGYMDAESGIKHYTLTLLKRDSCQSTNNDSMTTLVSNIILDPNTTNFTIRDLSLLSSTPYYIKLVVENEANLNITEISSPILFDDSLPTSGHVTEGTEFKDDMVWWGSTTNVSGVILHSQSPNGPACPSKSVSLTDSSAWKSINKTGFHDPSGKAWRLHHREANVFKDYVHNEVTIKLARDSKDDSMYSSIYYRSAEMAIGGTYEISVKAADGDGKAVTGITFWDGPEGQLAPFDYTAPEATDSVCDCCFDDDSAVNCSCDCNIYNITTKPATTVTTVTAASLTNISTSWVVVQDQEEYEKIEKVETIQYTPQRSCGLQIYSGSESFIIAWCRSFNDSSQLMHSSAVLPFNASKDFHRYTLKFSVTKDDLQPTWCLIVYADDEELTMLCGIPILSNKTQLVLHVWNRNDYLPEIHDIFDLWSTRATFRDLNFPPLSLCRYGAPFRGATNAIVKYEAGIGNSKGDTNILPFTEVHSPCIPCIDSCSKYNCDRSCRNEVVRIPFSLSGLNLQPLMEKQTDNGTEKILATYYITVKAVLGSGLYDTSSSNGFYVDVTPPTFDPDIMLYIDVAQGEFTPVEFQKSPDTIKSVWLCEDKESEIQNYEWAIGTSEGGQEIQPFISTGTTSLGINSNLEGILQHNTTYYVSVKCHNQAGLTTLIRFSKGVTVLLLAPDANLVSAEVLGAENFSEPIDPPTAKKSEDPTSIGGSWTVSPDPSVKRYDYCVGSSKDVLDDIFPCTWVGYNTSGEVKIKDGYLLIDNVKVRRISELRPLAIEPNDTRFQGDKYNVYNMEPGRTQFVSIRLCNEATLCTVKAVSSVVVTSPGSKMVVSHKGETVETEITGGSVGRRKRDLTAMKIRTPAGLEEGQSLLVNALTAEDLSKQYRSDASMNFVPYITNPNETMDLTERLLNRRVKRVVNSFTVTSVGQLSMTGPLDFTYHQDSSLQNTRLMLIHWNPGTQKWHVSQRTCLDNETHEFNNSVDGTVTEKVCNTRVTEQEITKFLSELELNNSQVDAGTNRSKRSVENVNNQTLSMGTNQTVDNQTTYFTMDTQFALAEVNLQMVNDLPYLTSDTTVIMEEDSGTLIYQMEAEDAESDPIEYFLETSPALCQISFTSQGRLLFTPCVDCHGNMTIGIRMQDVPGVKEITPAVSVINISVEILPVNDPPRVFLFDDSWNSLIYEDPTEPVMIYKDQGSNVKFHAVIGGYDVDDGDTLIYSVNTSSNGKMAIETTDNIVLNHFSTCKGVKCPVVRSSVNLRDMAWLVAEVDYEQNMSNFTGLETVKFVVQDSNAKFSDVITIAIAVLEFPCQNGGTCQSKNGTAYSCYDTRRIKDFDINYYCGCIKGWSGNYCQHCYNDECQDDEPFPVWAIVLIVLLSAVLAAALIVFILHRTGKLKLGKSLASLRDSFADIKSSLMQQTSQVSPLDTELIELESNTELIQPESHSLSSPEAENSTFQTNVDETPQPLQDIITPAPNGDDKNDMATGGDQLFLWEEVPLQFQPGRLAPPHRVVTVTHHK